MPESSRYDASPADFDAFYLGAGPLIAIVAGMALVPLRGLTPASNFTFVFIAITIVVAELGGRGPAIATALASALSLDFFLTRPYLRLSIEDKHDAIAFVGLTVCGLIVAALATRRHDRLARLESLREGWELRAGILEEWDEDAPLEPQLTRVLDRCRRAFPLAAAVIRDDGGAVRAASDPSAAERETPTEVLSSDTLRSVSGAPPGVGEVWGAGLPGQGGRIGLVVGRRRVGWLDVWGNGDRLVPESRRALADIARLITVLMTSTTTPAEAHP